MTKEELREIQDCTARARALYWKILWEGGFRDEEHAKAIFTCYFTLDKVCDLNLKYLAQLRLEKEVPK